MLYGKQLDLLMTHTATKDEVRHKVRYVLADGGSVDKKLIAGGTY